MLHEANGLGLQLDLSVLTVITVSSLKFQMLQLTICKRMHNVECGLFAQCGRVSTSTLTLARYVLETSLMDYSFVSFHESKMAAACLLLAMNMNCDGQWVRKDMWFHLTYLLTMFGSTIYSLAQLLLSTGRDCGSGQGYNKWSRLTQAVSWPDWEPITLGALIVVQDDNCCWAN